MKRTTFRIGLHVAYVLAIVFVVAVGITAWPYYALPIDERPAHPLHGAFKPGGLWGHGLGIVGSAMVLLLLTYSLRKREVLGIRWGAMSTWLDVHIFFGVVGPLLITLHTAMKLHGLWSVSWFSMMVVMISGVFGRYVYMQIPRDTRGHRLAMREARERLERIRESLRGDLPDDLLDEIHAVAAPREVEATGLRAILAALAEDIRLRMVMLRLRRRIRARLGKVPEYRLRAIVRLVRDERLLQRRIAMVDTMTSAVHYWHLFHKPFAWIMIAVMIVHVVVVVSFGYTWVF